MERVRELAVAAPGKEALRFAGTNEILTYAALNERADRVAHWLIGLGLQPGDGIALLFENHPALAVLAVGAERAGLYYTPISIQLKTREVAHVLKDCGARVLIASQAMRELAQTLVTEGATQGVACFMATAEDAAGRAADCAPAPGFASLNDALARVDTREPLPACPQGRDFLYSSGTTGLPKGVLKPLVPWEQRAIDDTEMASWRKSFGFDQDSVYLSTAPLYHAAPLRYLMRVLRVGGRIIVLRKFDPEAALETIERYRVTHSQWVPTMFIRMLNLPEAVRKRYDVRSLKVAIHAAAPCPPLVKEQMIEWFGPVIYEYYAGSEGVGLTAIGPEEWLAHRGSVGRAKFGTLHIVDDEDRDLPVGEIGRVFFEGGPPFEYFNDPVKTQSVFNRHGWATYGDIGHVDADGYLYLSDRRVDLIISGGVNVYPQEIENVLAEHPAVADVAVIGVPHAEFGEAVKAVVQLRERDAACPELVEALMAFCRERLSHIKVPRSVDFEEALPRHDNGKLLRRLLKERYRVAVR
ncbi:AMP-binding protein [Paraburkholderia oxyphila]|uniref:AMP-binding protein n=1 Tax=Paraburkholderia oxyphila TaxID=614212 RepID=UPI000489EAF2|nr:AMP-binding protein [Paraburkholderia oxyphila]